MADIPMVPVQIFNANASDGNEEEQYVETTYSGIWYEDHVQMTGVLKNGDLVVVRIMFKDLLEYQNIRQKYIDMGMILEE